MNKEQWLEERKKGIGGSDAAIILNKNPYIGKYIVKFKNTLILIYIFEKI